MTRATDASLDDQAQILAAMGQTSRLRILKLLSEVGDEGLAQGEIARRLELSQNGTSTHLAVLAKAALVTKTQAGRQAIYALRSAPLEKLESLFRRLVGQQ